MCIQVFGVKAFESMYDIVQEALNNNHILTKVTKVDKMFYLDSLIIKLFHIK